MRARRNSLRYVIVTLMATTLLLASRPFHRVPAAQQHEARPLFKLLKPFLWHLLDASAKFLSFSTFDASCSLLVLSLAPNPTDSA